MPPLRPLLPAAVRAPGFARRPGPLGGGATLRPALGGAGGKTRPRRPGRGSSGLAQAPALPLLLDRRRRPHRLRHLLHPPARLPPFHPRPLASLFGADLAASGVRRDEVRKGAGRSGSGKPPAKGRAARSGRIRSAAEPRRPSPPRRFDSVDQRWHTPSMDYSGRGPDRPKEGCEFSERAGHGGCRQARSE